MAGSRAYNKVLKIFLTILLFFGNIVPADAQIAKNSHTLQVQTSIGELADPSLRGKLYLESKLKALIASVPDLYTFNFRLTPKETDMSCLIDLTSSGVTADLDGDMVVHCSVSDLQTKLEQRFNATIHGNGDIVLGDPISVRTIKDQREILENIDEISDADLLGIDLVSLTFTDRRAVLDQIVFRYNRKCDEIQEKIQELMVKDSDELTSQSTYSGTEYAHYIKSFPDSLKPFETYVKANTSFLRDDEMNYLVDEGEGMRKFVAYTVYKYVSYEDEDEWESSPESYNNEVSTFLVSELRRRDRERRAKRYREMPPSKDYPENIMPEVPGGGAIASLTDEQLLELIRNGDELLKRHVIYEMSKRRKPEFIDDLKAVLADTENDFIVRYAALFTLSKYGKEVAAVAVEKGLDDPNRMVRFLALRMAKYVDSPEHAFNIIRLLHEIYIGQERRFTHVSGFNSVEEAVARQVITNLLALAQDVPESRDRVLDALMAIRESEENFWYVDYSVTNAISTLERGLGGIGASPHEPSARSVYTVDPVLVETELPWEGTSRRADSEAAIEHVQAAFNKLKLEFDNAVGLFFHGGLQRGYFRLGTSDIDYVLVLDEEDRDKCDMINGKFKEYLKEEGEESCFRHCYVADMRTIASKKSYYNEHLFNSPFIGDEAGMRWIDEVRYEAMRNFDEEDWEDLRSKIVSFKIEAPEKFERLGLSESETEFMLDARVILWVVPSKDAVAEIAPQEVDAVYFGHDDVNTASVKQNTVGELREAYSDRDQSRFHSLLLRWDKNDLGFSFELQKLLWEIAGERTRTRFGDMARGYLVKYGGYTLIDKIILDHKERYPSMKNLGVMALISLAERGIGTDKIIKYFKGLLSKALTDDKPSFTYIDVKQVALFLSRSGESEFMEEIHKALAEIVKSEGVRGALGKGYGPVLEALAYFGEEGEKSFFDLMDRSLRDPEYMENDWHDCYDYLKKIYGYRVKPREFSGFKALLEEAGSLNPEDMIGPRDPDNSYTYYHGTLLGLVKTAIEAKNGLLGSNEINVTRSRGKAAFWSIAREDGQFVSDDDYAPTLSYEEMDELMSPEARALPNWQKWGSIVLEFKVDDEVLSDSDSFVRTGEWNNMPSYPWGLLADSVGYTSRLTRKSKEEIVWRLGYTEPFEWMDNEWRDVISVMNDVRRRIGKLKEALDADDEVFFGTLIMSIDRDLRFRDRELENILIEASKNIWRIGKVARNYLYKFGSINTADYLLQKVARDDADYVDIGILAAIAKRGVRSGEIKAALNGLLRRQYLDRPIGGYVSGSLPVLVKALAGMNDSSEINAFYGWVKGLVEEKGMVAVIGRNSMYLPALEALISWGMYGEEAFCRLLQEGPSVNIDYIRGAIGYRCNIETQQEYDELHAQGRIDRDALFKPKNKANFFHYYHGTLLGLVVTAIEHNSGLLGGSSSCNVTPNFGTAAFWSRMRTDGFFMSDDNYGVTQSYEELEAFMNEKVKALSADIKFRGIVLEFEKDSEFMDDTEVSRTGSEWNNVDTYPWISLSDPRGLGHRLARRGREYGDGRKSYGKADIVELMDYTEPFEWMDDEWRDVIDEYRVSKGLERLADVEAAGKKKGKSPDAKKLDTLLDEIKLPENVSRKLLASIFSILLSRKLVMAFDNDLERSRFADIFLALKEIERQKVKNKELEKLLNNLIIIRDKPTPEDLRSSLSEYLDSEYTEVFLFANARNIEAFKGLSEQTHETSGIHEAYLDEGDHSWDGMYYPLTEVVMITLSSYLDDDYLTDILPVIDELDINIGSILDDGGKLMFKLIPDAEPFDADRKFIERQKMLARFVTSA